MEANHKKKDYLLMSPDLAAKAKLGGVERHGVWGGKHGTLFPHYPEIKEERDAAPDHACLWVDPRRMTGIEFCCGVTEL